MSKVETKLEVVTIPVSDVDRAKTFYEGLGWRVDADFSKGDDWRVVQLTPPGSACSIFVGKGLTTAAPGSVQGLLLIVDDIQAARAAGMRAIGVTTAHRDDELIAAGASLTIPDFRGLEWSRIAPR